LIWIRSAIFNVCFFTVTVIILIVGSPALLANRHSVFKMARFWSRTSLWLLERICGLRVEFRGIDRIPDGGFLLASKHQSALETFALFLHLRDFSFILKRELMQIPIFGWYLRRAEMIGIDRTSGRAALQQAVERSRGMLSEGRCILIFPEGTRTKPGAAPSYKVGVAHIYSATGAACLPAALNTGVFWPRRSFRKYPGRVVIEFLPLIEPGLKRPEFIKALETSIESASNKLLAEAIEADPSVQARIDHSG
jgi:1-acyl-sn-glycerol-3-phosphate acyltransferase